MAISTVGFSFEPVPDHSPPSLPLTTTGNEAMSLSQVTLSVKAPYSAEAGVWET